MSADDNINNMSMIGLFKMELESQYISLAETLEFLKNQPDSVEHLASFQRSIHSLKGAARIVDVEYMIELAKNVEDALNNYSPDAVDPEIFINFLSDIVNFIKRLSEQKGEELLDWIDLQHGEIHSLINRLSIATSDSKPTKLTLDKDAADLATKDEGSKPLLSELSDLSLINIFREDAENHCAILTDNLLRLESEPKDVQTLESAMRSTHSIKGAARVIKLFKIVDLTHNMEDIFVAAQHGQIYLESHHIDLLLKSVDFIKAFIQTNENELDDWFAENEIECSLLTEKLLGITAATEDHDHQGHQDLEPAGISSEPPQDADSPPKKEKAALSPPPSGQRRSTDKDFQIKTSASGMSRLIGLSSEMLLEAKWQPILLSKSHKLKKAYDLYFQQVEEIRTKFHESHFDPLIEYTFKKLHKHGSICNAMIKSFLSEIEDHAVSANEISHKLHKEMINSKMQPFSEGIKAFPRLVRDLAKKLNKNVNLDIVGSETLVDRDILEKIESPLYHLITNSIDHGIETKEERKSAGKSTTATIRIEAKHKSGFLQIIISDDGRGIDLEKLRKTIVEKELVSPSIAKALSEKELTEFIFLPNFSTKDETTQVSGRGVGLDVVYETVRQVRGTTNISSISGKGTFFELKLPLTLSITKCLLCQINNEGYAFPLININHVTKITTADLYEVEGRQYFISNDNRIGIISAQQVLDLTENPQDKKLLSVLVLQSSGVNYGMIVDKFTGIRDLMVQPLNQRLGKLRSVSAAAIDENGTPILIMDIQDIIQNISHIVTTNHSFRIDQDIQNDAKSVAKKILVVDDSATVREVERKLLTEHGYEVTTAEDGLDGWNCARKEKFDLIITDIDMPHMDGIEFLLQVREDSKLQKIPVIIVSYKDRDEDRNKGLNAGADYYMTKGSFQDQTLIDAIHDLIGAAKEF